MMSTCQNWNFTLGIGAPFTKFEFALRSSPSHHLAYGSSLGFAPNFLYNGAMGSHMEPLFTTYCACGSVVALYTFRNINKDFGVSFIRCSSFLSVMNC